MTSAIDPTKPEFGTPTTQSVRDNFQAAHDEIEALQADSGTWTPVLTCATPGDLAITYAKQVGHWERIQKRIYWEVYVSTSAYTFTTASGGIKITGLPTAMKNQTDLYALAIAEYQGIKTGSLPMVLLRTGFNSSDIILVGSGVGLSTTTINMSDTTTGTNLLFIGSGSYPID